MVEVIESIFSSRTYVMGIVDDDLFIICCIVDDGVGCGMSENGILAADSSFRRGMIADFFLLPGLCPSFRLEVDIRYIIKLDLFVINIVVAVFPLLKSMFLFFT